MEWVEASGRTLVEAREAVFDLLGVAEEDAEVVVVSEPKAGLFGRVRGEARVQARVLPKAPPAKRGRRQRSDRKGQERSGGSSGGKETPSTNGSTGDQESSRAGSAGGSDGRRVSTAAKESNRTGGRSGADQPSMNGRETGAGSNRSRGRRSRAGGEERSATGGNEVAGGASEDERTGRSPVAGSTRSGSDRKSEERESDMEESLTLQQQGAAGQEFMSGLLREFGVQGSVEVREIDDETVELAATGDDLGLLVGPKGSTLSAVQDLVRTYVQRQSESRTDRILVDIGGYREKRTAALRRFAEGIVTEVRESGAERMLEPMNAADRKVVHDTVNDLEGVSTRSEGEDPNRYVVIFPEP